MGVSDIGGLAEEPGELATVDRLLPLRPRFEQGEPSGFEGLVQPLDQVESHVSQHLVCSINRVAGHLDGTHRATVVKSSASVYPHP